MKKLGFIVNPIAGMGGRVGLKGTDGEDVVRRARELGAEPESPRKATEALKALAVIKDDIELVTYPVDMGESEAIKCGFTPTVLGAINSEDTTSKDTRLAARDMQAYGVDLILFAGGDGTARDIYDAIGQEIPALGIPTGVKIHSSVYAITPRDAGRIVLRFLKGELTEVEEAEVMDIDEDAFRQGTVTAKLHGYLSVPKEPRFVQGQKSGSVGVEKEALISIATEVVENMEDDTLYIIGPGTTTKSISDALGIEKTLLGVDVVLNRELVASDVSEKELLNLIGNRKAKIVVTVIGGQGYIFGRGNQQLSPEVIRQVGKDNIIVIATREKLLTLEGKPLLVDMGDVELDQALSGYIKVVTGFRESHVYRVGYSD